MRVRQEIAKRPAALSAEQPDFVTTLRSTLPNTAPIGCSTVTQAPIPLAGIDESFAAGTDKLVIGNREDEEVEAVADVFGSRRNQPVHPRRIVQNA